MAVDLLSASGKCCSRTCIAHKCVWERGRVGGFDSSGHERQTGGWGWGGGWSQPPTP